MERRFERWARTSSRLGGGGDPPVAPWHKKRTPTRANSHPKKFAILTAMRMVGGAYRSDRPPKSLRFGSQLVSIFPGHFPEGRYPGHRARDQGKSAPLLHLFYSPGRDYGGGPPTGGPGPGVRTPSFERIVRPMIVRPSAAPGPVKSRLKICRQRLSIMETPGELDRFDTGVL
ncbi:hypothetical protein ES708_06802 [subsurface metagenome]